MTPAATLDDLDCELRQRALRVVVIGAGLAGLAVSIGLARRHDVTILERSSAAAAKGFGFVLMPNGIEALNALVPMLPLATLGCALSRAHLITTDGVALAGEDLDGVIAIDRPRLLAALARYAPPVSHDTDVKDIRPSAIGPGHVITADGRRIDADLIVACDGVGSRARRLLAPNARPNSGRVKEIVCVASTPGCGTAMDRTFTKVLHPGGGLAVGMAPTGPDSVVWFVQFDHHRFPAPAPDDIEEFLDRHLDDFESHLRPLRTMSDPRNAHVWHTVDVDPLESTTSGNLVLLGDAAQPVLPFTSQGANGALEDALRLTHLMHLPGQVDTLVASHASARKGAFGRRVESGRQHAQAFLRPPCGESRLPLDEG